MHPTLYLAVLSAFASCMATADVVHFVNGDRLTGTLADAESGTVAIDVPHIGVVIAPADHVAKVERDIPSATAASTAAPSTPAARSAVAEEGAARPFADWDLRSDFGIAASSGNTRTRNVDFVIGAERRGQRFDNVLGANVHKAGARASGLGPTADTKDQLGLNYDLRWKYQDTWYAVANFGFFRDPIKDIDRRVTAGIGLGHRFWESERGSLETDIGVSQVFERLDVGGSVDESQDPALRWSLHFKRWLFGERLEVFHNSEWLYILASESASVWDSDTGLRLRLAGRWQAGLRLDLQHETRPAANRGKTDLGYALTLGVAL